LRFEGEAVSGSDGAARNQRDAFERVEVDAVGADLFEGCVSASKEERILRACGIPSEDGEKNFDVVAVKIVDEFF